MKQIFTLNKTLIYLAVWTVIGTILAFFFGEIYFWVEPLFIGVYCAISMPYLTIKYLEQIEVKKTKLMYLILGFLIATLIVFLIDGGIESFYCYLNPNDHDFNILVYRRMSWEQYIAWYFTVTGLLTISIFTLLLVYCTVERK